MTNLPKWIYFNEVTYHLKEWQEHNDDILDNWWFCGYWPDGDINKMPAETTDGYIKYSLVSVDPCKETAEKDLLERINNMKPWL